jgi:hypothetical protein
MQATSSSTPPKNWPKTLVYLTQMKWSNDVPPELKNKYFNPSPSQPSRPSHFTKILKIENPSHPAFGQCGLFAAKTIPPETHICDYLGFVTTDEKASETSNYLMRLAPGLLCDGEQMGNEARMINDFHGVADSPNVRFKTYNSETGEQRVGIFSQKRKIKKGEELLVDYGRKFQL